MMFRQILATDIGGLNTRLGVLDFGGEVIGGKLQLSLGYSQIKVSKETAEELLSNYVANLKEIITHCINQTCTNFTPSDFDLVKLEQQFLDRLFIEQKEIVDIYPLSPMQEGMLYHYLLEANSQSYFEQVSYRIEGNLNLKYFEQAWNYVIQNNEIFRTIFRWVGVEKPVQIVLKHVPFKVLYRDLSEVPSEEQENELMKLRDEDRQNQFNLEQGSLMRVINCKLKDNVNEIIWSFHHILIDGWCIRFIMKELFTAYQQLENGIYLQPLNKYKYKNYIEYINQQSKNEVYQFWKEYLEDLELPTLLPTDYMKKQEIQQVSRVYTYLTCEETKVLNELAKNEKITVNSIVQTALGILFQRYSNSKDVVFGAVVAGRPALLPGVEEMIGLFINTVPVRVKNDSNTQVITLLHQIYQESIIRQDYEHAGLVDIKKYCGVKGETPLFDYVIAYENFGESKQGSKIDSEFKFYNTSGFEMSNYDLAFRVSMAERLNIEIQYNQDLFKEDTIQRLLEHFKNILISISCNSEQQICEISMLNAAEKEQVIFEFNDTRADYPFDKCYHQLFEEQVKKTPNRIAMSYREHKLTYKQLNAKANQIAHLLLEYGVEPGTIIGLMVDRSLDMVSGLLGILKSGGAYLPIDPDYPEERITYMLQDSQTPVLLTLSHLRTLIPAEYVGKVVCLDCMDELNGKDFLNPEISITSNNLAYVIYTSGSTGRPKGTLVKHQGLVNLVTSWSEAFEITEEDRGSQYTSFGFDALTVEIHPFLVVGGCVFIVPDEVRYSVYGLKDWFKEKGITKAFLPTAMAEEVLKTFTPDELELETLMIAGDYLKYVPSGNWKMTLINAYGPTEDSVATTYFNITANSDVRPIPIGKPFKNHRVYVLDADGNPAPIGVSGELYLAGAGVARGYLNQPELTCEKFLDDPFVPGDRMYKSGDLGKWLPDGNLEFLGRMDNQVKIRGFRVELNEIEVILLKHYAIKEVCVVDRLNEQNERYLAAYVVTDNNLTEEDLRTYLLQNLPHYYVPAVFVLMDKLPLNPNGKIDRKALPEPVRSDLEVEYIAPRTPVEKKLEEIWTEVLNVEKIGVRDNFFEMGGHSLSGIQLMGKVFEEFAIELPIMFLYEHPTIENMVEALHSQSSKNLDCVIYLRKGNGNKNVFCIHPSATRPTCYQLLANLMNSEYNVYGIQALGVEDKEQTLPESVEEMAEYYISEIKEVQAEGPYNLIGYSAGSHIAYEMARQLELQGETIARLTILDVPPFGGELIKQGTDLEEEIKKMIIGFANLDHQAMDLSNKSLEETLEIISKMAGFKKQYSNMTLDDLYREKDIILNINQCSIKYQPKSIINTDIYLFKAQDTHFHITLEDWKIWTNGKVNFREISGDHFTILQSPSVEDLVEILDI